MLANEFDLALVDLDNEILDDPSLAVDLFPQLVEMQRECGLLHGERPICPFLRPYFLHRSRYDEIARAAEVLAEAFERVAHAALDDDALMDALALTARERAWARVSLGYETLCVTSRLDSFLTTDGFKFLEYNAESPAGLADQKLLVEMFERIPQVRRFLDRYPTTLPTPRIELLDALLAAYAAWGGSKSNPCIAIVDWAGVPTESEFHLLKAFFDERGYPTVIADPHEIVYEGGELRTKGAPIDILYKRVIIHELFDRFDDDHPIFHAYRDGAVCMANSFRVKTVHKKASFAILSDPAYASLFTTEQREVIARHIPWTRLVRAGEVDYRGETVAIDGLLARHQRDLVLKPNDAYGGEGVVVGSAVDSDVWAETAKKAFASPYVVQERVPIRQETLPVYRDGRIELQAQTVDFDPFLFNNRVHGGLVRLASSVLSNVSSGGGETAIVIVE